MIKSFIVVITIISTIGLIMSIIAYKENLTKWLGVISGVILILCINIMIGTAGKDLTEIESKVQPQIDTVVTIKKGISDTTYIYTFVKENQK